MQTLLLAHVSTEIHVHPDDVIIIIIGTVFVLILSQLVAFFRQRSQL